MASLNSLMTGGYDPFEFDVAECDEYDSQDDCGEFDDLIPPEEYVAIETVDDNDLPF